MDHPKLTHLSEILRCLEIYKKIINDQPKLEKLFDYVCILSSNSRVEIDVNQVRKFTIKAKIHKE